MLEEAAIWHGKETGGMMFGTISEIAPNLKIKISKTIVPTDEYCSRKSAFFEIDPLYAKTIVENEKLPYIGNWHKHLGYGGPSYGDLRQIEDFFTSNPHLNIVLTFIIDNHSQNEYEVIIEVYRRRETDLEETEDKFDTYRVLQKNISFFPVDVTSLEPEMGISEEKILKIKKELIAINDYKFSIDEIDVLAGQTQNEKLISFPQSFVIHPDEDQIILDLLILISFPPNFPEGEIFIDISSKDLSKNITFEKHSAKMLEDDLIQPFLISLKASLEMDVPNLLLEPLWKVMRSTK
jgi:hypothetical protein